MIVRHVPRLSTPPPLPDLPDIRGRKHITPAERKMMKKIRRWIDPEWRNEDEVNGVPVLLGMRLVKTR